MTEKMLDVSSNNHPNNAAINWAAVNQAGYHAVMIKATESNDYVNPFLTADANGAVKAGLQLGYYHYAQPGKATIDQQANNFWQHIKDLPRSLGIAVDMEETNGLSWTSLDAWSLQFLNTIPALVKQKTIYTDAAWLPHFPRTLAKHTLWLADWGNEPKQKVWAWQSGQAEVPGITGQTDVGTFYG